jgi:hypothetical protein
VTTYYPGTDTSEDAETVRVAAAAETGGVNIRWGQTAPVVAIRGVVEGLPDPRTSPAGARLSSSPQFELSGPEGQTIRPLGTSMRSGGEFELRVFGARSVTLTARARGGGSPAGEYSGRVRIELGDQDVEGVRIPLRGPIESVPGRVTLASPGGDVDLQALSVRLEYGVLPGGSSSGGRGTRVQADGSFDLRDVGLRDYVLSLSSQQAADFYIESARYGTDDPLSGWFTPVDDAQRRLEIVVGTSFGDLTGRVVANEGAWAGAMVTLVPDGDRIGRSDLYRSIPTDGEGRYRLERVPVGRYRLFAWNRIPDGAVENADFMLPYRGRGQPVTVEANGSGEVDLRLIVR